MPAIKLSLKFWLIDLEICFLRLMVGEHSVLFCGRSTWNNVTIIHEIVYSINQNLVNPLGC